jgi:hypothetical protein
MMSRLSYKRGASGQFRDISQVTSRNFDWLPFTLPSGRLLRSFNRQRRAIVKKRKSAVNADSKKGGNMRPMNIRREVKAPPREQAPKPTDDEVLPLKIHSPLEESDNLRESVNYRKQDRNTITTHREIACYDVEKEAYDPQFWTFFYTDWYRSVY